VLSKALEHRASGRRFLLLFALTSTPVGKHNELQCSDLPLAWRFTASKVSMIASSRPVIQMSSTGPSAYKLTAHCAELKTVRNVAYEKENLAAAIGSNVLHFSVCAVRETVLTPEDD
jgi:hypothetical protein